MIAKEGDAFFERNKIAMDIRECSKGVSVFSEFYDTCKKRILKRY